MSLLSIQGVRVAYGKIVALADVSLHVEEGEIVTLVGANGAGKSSLMRAIMGLAPVQSGAVEFAGRGLLRMRPHEVMRQGIAYVPEGRGTLRRLTVRENLVMGAFSRRWDRATKKDFDGVIERFPALESRLDQTAGTLSGGEQQMMVIGRALMSRPKLLLLDEPSLGLAPLMAARIFETVAALSAQGVTVLLVEQNAVGALKLARRGYVLEMGRIVLEGTDLLGDPRVRQAYLGEIEIDAESVPS
jgi:branched-chain amino acid transport system ATP-binding protein